MKNDNLKKQLLTEELDLLKQAVETLNLSIDKCEKILLKSEDFTFEDLESFDSLTSKFGRTSDIFMQKVLRTVWMLLHEPFVPFIDLMNNAEKIRLVKSAEKLIEIRDLRNQITHEYIPEAINELVPEVIDLSAALIENIDFTKKFLSERGWINQH